MHNCVFVIANEVSEIDYLMAPFHSEDDRFHRDFYVYEYEEERAVFEREWRGKYPSFDAYIDDIYREERDELIGEFGSWWNKDSFHDGYEIGGRYSRLLPMKSGRFSSICCVKDLSFDLVEAWYQEAIHIYEVVKENKALRDGEDEYDFHGIVISDSYPDKETWARHYATIGYYTGGLLADDKYTSLEPYAYKQGKAFDVVTRNIAKVREFLESQDPEKLVIIVDCHT